MKTPSEMARFNGCDAVSIWRNGPGDYSVAITTNEEPHRGFRQIDFAKLSNAIAYAKATYPELPIWREMRDHYLRIHNPS